MLNLGMANGGLKRRWRGKSPRGRFVDMDAFFNVALPVILLAVVTTLFFGLYALFRGGDFGRSYSNKLMRLRVLLQFIAVCILVAAFYWRSRGT